MPVEDRLERAPAPDAVAARERGRRVVMSAPLPPPQRRRRWLPAAVVCAAAVVAVTPAGAEIGGFVSDLVDSPPEAPAPQPRLGPLPAEGRLLVNGPAGVFVVEADGSRVRVGEYDDVTWSPQGRFVGATSGHELRAIEPDGDLRWSLERPEPVSQPRWALTGFRVAYRSGDDLRVVAGDGSGDHGLVDDVGAAAPAWRPVVHELAIARPDGAVELWDADRVRERWRVAAGSPVLELAWIDGYRLVVVRRDSVEFVSAGGRVKRRVALSAPVDAAAVGAGGLVALARGAEVSTLRSSGRERVRLSAADPVHGLAFAPEATALLVAAGDQWVFLPVSGTGPMSTVHVPGFPSVAGWCCGPGSGTWLAEARLPDGRRITLSARQDSAGPCLVITGIDRFKRQCGRTPSTREPPAGPLVADPMAQRDRRSPLEVYGETRPEVARVMIRYRGGAADATMLRVSDPTALAQAGIAEPFGYFVAELPRRARNVRAVALDAAGAVIATRRYAVSAPGSRTAFLASRPGPP